MKPAHVVLLLFVVVALLAAAGLYADVSALAQQMAAFRWIVLAPALSLAFANYVVRFGKWHYFLGTVHGSVPKRDSALVFFSGLSMSVTPGKLGELLKAYLLQERCNVPPAATMPVVVAERLTDLLALIVLSAFGVATLGYGWDILAAAAALCVPVLVVALWRRGGEWVLGLLVRLPVLRSKKDLFAGLQEALYTLVGARCLAAGTALSVAAWFAECVAFLLVARAAGVDLSLANATFIYSLGTIAGAVTMLPGGLVATEAGMVFLLAEFFRAASPAQAVTAVLIVRLCTLWFAVAVGFVALALGKIPARHRAG